MQFRSLVGLLVCGVMAMSCQPPLPVEEAPSSTPTTYHYSPFVVQVPQSEMVFDAITFKDVGLQRSSLDPTDPMLEAIAQSVAYSLQLEPSLHVSHPLVEYRAELADPANHAWCEMDHLYVDVWNGDEQWGYSLWSGCSEADNFAWEQVPIPNRQSHLSQRVDPLGESIAATLVEAHQRECYSKTC